SLAGGVDAFGLGHAEVFEQVHARRPRVALAAEDQHLHVVAELELVEHFEHPAVELGAHAVALVGAVEADPGDAVDHVVGDGLGLGARIGLGGLGHLHHPRAYRAGLSSGSLSDIAIMIAIRNSNRYHATMRDPLPSYPGYALRRA